MHFFYNARQIVAGLLVGLGLTLSGCTSLPPDVHPERAASSTADDAETLWGRAKPNAHTTRYDRYTLVSTHPRPDQVELLNQIIDIRVPNTLTPSVLQGMTYTLRHSGYQLCPGAGDVAQLYAHPLPASHFKLGPMTVRDALQTLAGPAWRMEVDEKARSICFVSRTTYQRPSLANTPRKIFTAPAAVSVPGGE